MSLTFEAVSSVGKYDSRWRVGCLNHQPGMERMKQGCVSFSSPFFLLLAQSQFFLLPLSPLDLKEASQPSLGQCVLLPDAHALRMPSHGLIIQILAEQHWFKRHICAISSHCRGSKAFCKSENPEIHMTVEQCRDKWPTENRKGVGASEHLSLDPQPSRQWIDLSLKRWKSSQVEVWGKNTFARRARHRCCLSQLFSSLQPPRQHTHTCAQIYRNPLGDANLKSKEIRGLSWCT